MVLNRPPGHRKSNPGTPQNHPDRQGQENNHYSLFPHKELNGFGPAAGTEEIQTGTLPNHPDRSRAEELRPTGHGKSSSGTLQNIVWSRSELLRTMVLRTFGALFSVCESSDPSKFDHDFRNSYCRTRGVEKTDFHMWFCRGRNP